MLTGGRLYSFGALARTVLFVGAQEVCVEAGDRDRSDTHGRFGDLACHATWESIVEATLQLCTAPRAKSIRRGYSSTTRAAARLASTRLRVASLATPRSVTAACAFVNGRPAASS